MGNLYIVLIKRVGTKGTRSVFNIRRWSVVFLRKLRGWIDKKNVEKLEFMIYISMLRKYRCSKRYNLMWK